MSKPSYDVFLNFRGEGAAKNFADHLYAALVREGIFTFIDDHEIQRGENITLAIQKAIREAKISIIVFSRTYASSAWCLDELSMIIECKKLHGHIAMPVFYDVDPSDVRKQRGSFAEAFARHEERFMGSMDRVERWRDALREVADLTGFVLQDGLESQIIQSIVAEVGSRLRLTMLSVAPFLVGIDSRVSLIHSWLQDESVDVGIAIIYGIGGIGKTAIAKAVYNQNFKNFDGSCFLANVSEISEQPNGFVRLQGQLLSNLLKRKSEKIYSVDEGIIKIKDATFNKRILLILDDVDQLDQLHSIIGKQEWFHRGCKIIITTRHKNLLMDYAVSLKYEVEKLDDDESLQLFNWHAFRPGHSFRGYEKHTEDVVHYCCGLPLALEVLGSYLCGRTAKDWESALQKWKEVPHPTIQKILRKSFDSLQDDHDKSLFLHLACFFTGMDKDYIIRILDGFNFGTTIGIQNLMDRCLITINRENLLMIHPLLRDMGREIARKESLVDPRKQSMRRDMGREIAREELLVDAMLRDMGREIAHEESLVDPMLIAHEESLVDPRKQSEQWILHEVSCMIKHKVTFEWVFIITNLLLEVLLMIFDQMTSPQKPHYALIILIVSLAAMMICVIELVCRRWTKKVTLKRQGMFCWSRYTFIDVFSLICAVCQCVFSSVAYSYLHEGAESPIKISVVSVIFVICLAVSKLINNRNEADMLVGQNNKKWLAMNHIA